MPRALTCLNRTTSLIISSAILFSIIGMVACGGGSAPVLPPVPTPQQADFHLLSSAPSVTLQQLGLGVPYTLSIDPVNGFSGTVLVTFPALPTGIRVLPDGPYQISPGESLSLNLSASDAAAVGNSTVTIRAESGNLVHTQSLSITVTPSASFQLSVSPSPVTIGPNAEATTQVTLTPLANFGDSIVSLSFGSHHPGANIDMDLSTSYLSAAAPTATITFRSAFNTQAGAQVPLEITGSAPGAPSVTAPFFLNVTNPAPACRNTNRSTIRRTDTGPTGIVYDPSRKLVFAAVDKMNLVYVFSSLDGHTVGTIPVPAPRQLDITADGTRILVGSRLRYLSWIDPDTLQVVAQSAPPASTSSATFQPSSIRLTTLASGKVLVATDTDGVPLEWDPKTDTYKRLLSDTFSYGDIALTRSADHKKAVALNPRVALAVFDSDADSFGPVQRIPASNAALSPDGSRLAVLGDSPSLPGGHQIALYDSDFNVLATYQINDSTIPTNLFFSRDGNLVYVVGGTLIIALNSSDLSFAGAVPASGVGTGRSGDVDESGMLFLPGTRSVAFADAAAPCALGIDYLFSVTLSPPQGTVLSPLATTLTASGVLTGESQIFFGAAPGSLQATPGTDLTYTPPNRIQVTPPSAAAAGVANVTVVNPDGWIAIGPDSYTYGADVLGMTPNGGPAGGGTSVRLYGYGFGLDHSAIQVTVGGNNATVTRVSSGPGISPFPFPMQYLEFTTPAGLPGYADVVVTTPTGSATVPRGFQYVDVETYPVSPALAQIVYDKIRQQLYASDTAAGQIRFFHLPTRKANGSIFAGTGPVGLALTPDASKLVVANSSDSSVSIIDLAHNTLPRLLFTVALPDQDVSCEWLSPYAIATTSNHKAVVAASCFDVASGTLVIVDLDDEYLGCGLLESCTQMSSAFPGHLSYNLSIAGTPDGNKVFVYNGITTGVWDVASDTFLSQPYYNETLAAPVAVTAAAAQGNLFAYGYEIADAAVYRKSLMQGTDYLREGVDLIWRFGEKLHASGALLYFPEPNALSIYDAHQGRLRRRIALPVELPQVFDSMAIDETGSRVFLIDARGITILEIPDLPLGLGNVTPSRGSAVGGDTVRLHGSGFQPGARVLFGEVEAVATFVDAITLEVTVPTLPVGRHRVTIVNPDDSEYSLDTAFEAE